MSTSTECTRSERSISVSWFFRLSGGVSDVFCDARGKPWVFLGLGGVPFPFAGEKGVSCFFLGGGGVLLVFLEAGGVSCSFDGDEGKASRLVFGDGGVSNAFFGKGVPFPFLEVGGVSRVLNSEGRVSRLFLGVGGVSDLMGNGGMSFPLLEVGGVSCDFPEGGREVGGVSCVFLAVGGVSSPVHRSSPFFFLALGLACSRESEDSFKGEYCKALGAAWKCAWGENVSTL